MTAKTGSGSGGHRGGPPARTTLAWTRTAAGLITVTFLCLRFAHGSSSGAQILGVWGMSAISAVLVTNRARYEREQREIRTGHSGDLFFLILILTASVVVIAATSAVVVLIR
ncbi:MAG: DUF202 domain-containing protein [Nocardiaceae bacterium]|nr:DUF202 domain-containing protein [Nocardiaceae bacterium]